MKLLMRKKDPTEEVQTPVVPTEPIEATEEQAAEQKSAAQPVADTAPTSKPSAKKFNWKRLNPAPKGKWLDPKRMMWQAIAIVLCVTYLIVGHQIAVNGLDGIEGATDVEYIRVRVTELLGRDQQDFEVSMNEFASIVTLTFEAEVTEGERTGEELTVIQQSDPYYQLSLNEVRVGDDVVVAAVDSGGELIYQYHAHVRVGALIVLGVIFGVCLLLFGHVKGFNTILSLGFTVAAIFVVFVPALLSGQNIYVWTIVTLLYTVGMTLMIVYGPTRLSLVAGIGCISGASMVMLLTFFMSRVMELTGIVDEQSAFLMQLNTKHPIDLVAIVFASITIGAIGAIMDVSISISSSLQEVHVNAPDLTRMQLFRSGLTIGRDMMGTMSNTLVLAYIGASLSMTLLMYASSVSLLSLFNRELILVEILQILAGSLGILLTIPLTSFICSVFYIRKDGTPAEVAAEPGADVPLDEPEVSVDALILEAVKKAAHPAQTETDTPEQTAEDPENDVDADESLLVPEEEEAHTEENIANTGFFGRVARIYRDLDSAYDIADERNAKKYAANGKKGK